MRRLRGWGKRADVAIYLANIGLIIAWAIALLLNEPTRVKRVLFCCIAAGQWILLSGLRHVSIGADTLAYKVWSFDVLARTPWADVLESLIGTYSQGMAFKDPGYGLFVKGMQLISGDYQVYLLIVAIIFTVPLGILIYRRSAELCLSFLIYSCLFASFFALTGIRQTIATALAVLVGYPLIRERRLAPFLLISLVAFTIHKSSACFIPFYWLSEMTPTRRRFLVFACAAVLVAVLRSPVMVFLAGLTGYEQYAQQWAGAGTYVFTAMLILVLAAAYIRLPQLLQADSEAGAALVAVLVALVLTPLSYVDPSAMRVVQYYSFFLILLVPSVVRSFSAGWGRSFVYYVAVAVLILLFVRSGMEYAFFWQGGA